LISYEHPRFGTVRQVGCPVKVDDLKPQYGPASALGADTNALLRELLHLPDGEIATLRAAGAI